MYLRKCLVLVYGAMVIPFVGISADNVNVALHKPVIASSQQKEFPASNVTDGVISRTSSWTSAKGARTPHILDLKLQKYYDVKFMLKKVNINLHQQVLFEFCQWLLLP